MKFDCKIFSLIFFIVESAKMAEELLDQRNKLKEDFRQNQN